MYFASGTRGGRERFSSNRFRNCKRRSQSEPENATKNREGAANQTDELISGEGKVKNIPLPPKMTLAEYQAELRDLLEAFAFESEESYLQRHDSFQADHTARFVHVGDRRSFWGVGA